MTRRSEEVKIWMRFSRANCEVPLAYLHILEHSFVWLTSKSGKTICMILGHSAHSLWIYPSLSSRLSRGTGIWLNVWTNSLREWKVCGGRKWYALTSPPHLKTSVSFVSFRTWPACFFEYTGFSCAFVPGRSILRDNALLSCVSLFNSSPSAPRLRASSMAVATKFNCSLSRRIISSVSPLSRVTKGCVHGSPIGKLNFNFC